MIKRFKKIIFTLILTVTIFNFVIGSNPSFAEERTLNAKQIEVVNSVTNLAGGIVSILLWKERALIAAIALGLDNVTAHLVKDFGINKDVSATDKKYYEETITPYAIFFNKYNLLDINFFDINGANTGEESSSIKTIREEVAKWYFILRNLSAACMLAILIYVGIRMATSTLVEDKAKYKKMLMDWVVGMVILFMLHYIMIFVIYLNNSLVKALEIAFTSMNNGTADNPKAMSELIQNLALNSVLSIGITSFSTLIVFVMIVFQTIMFLIAYVTRMVKVAFLIIISPLITLTYAIDRMGDGKAQAFNTWMKEFVFTILIQPFHCIVYFAFGSVAFSLLTASDMGNITMGKLPMGIMAVMCLKFINDAEQIVRHIFHFEDDNRGALATGAVVTMAALSNAQKLGGAARQGLNGMRSGFANMRNNGTRTLNQVQNSMMNSNSSLIQGAGKGLEKSRQALDKGIDVIKNNSATRAIGNVMEKGKHTITGVTGSYRNAKEYISKSGKLGEWIVKRNSLTHALGNMAILASMASGQSTMEALGKGAAFEKAAEEFFPNSRNGIAASQSSNLENVEQQEYDDLKEKLGEVGEDLNDIEDEADRLGLDKDETDANSHDDKADKLDKEASELEAEANTAFSEEDAKRLRELEEEMAGATSVEEARKAAKHKDELIRLQKAKAESEAKKMEAEALRAESAQEREKANVLKHRNALRTQFASMASQREHFFDREAIKQRMQRRRSGANKKELQTIGNEIIKLILEAKLAHKARPTTMDHDEELDEDTIDEANKSFEFIKDTLALAAKKHSDVNMEDLISRSTDLDPADSVYEDLKQQISKYFTEVRKDELATAWQRGSQYGASAGDMDDAMVERVLAALYNGNIKP